MAEFSETVEGLTNPSGNPTTLTLSTNYGRVFIDHVDLKNVGDRDYKEVMELSVPEALALYDLLKLFFDKE